jgi:uncharacterized LabA/DUF88 family protein
MKEKNIAFIDAQNLHLGIQSFGWKIDLKKFRIFLHDKFQVEEAYYCLGYISDDEQDLYTAIQKAGFLLIFREHSSNMKGKKKGNVDVDIVFEVMKKMILEEEFDKIVLVSGDGDYIKMVRFLISRNKLKRVLFPSSKPSSLYKKFSNLFYYHLKDAQQKIEYL